MSKLYLFILVFLPITVISQTVSGKVYDAEVALNGAKIINLTQNLIVYADEEGNFKIVAHVNDQIAFTTLFHEPQMIIITQKDFDNVMVIELMKKVNELDKVYLNKINEKKFESSKVENQLNSQIKNDIELRPELYNPPPNTNMDFLAIGSLIAKLFKKRMVEEPIQFAGYLELRNFFETDAFFNTQFLSSKLNIDEEYHPLFLDFCDAKGIEKTLLLKENQLPLFDTLVAYHKEFSALIQDFKKD